MDRRVSVVALVLACASPAPPPTAPPPRPTAAPIPLPPRRRPSVALEQIVSATKAAAPDGWFEASARIALSDDPAASDVLVTHLAGARAKDVASALALLGGGAARETLGVALDHDDPEVAMRAAVALGELGDPLALPALAAALARPDLVAGCDRALDAAATLAAAGSTADRQRVTRAAAASPTSCGVAARETGLAALRVGDAEGALDLLSHDALARGPLGDEVSAALGALSGDLIRGRARDVVRRSFDPDSLDLAIQVVRAARDDEGLAAAAARLDRVDLSSCGMAPGATAAEPRACRIAMTLLVGLARAGDPRALEPARALARIAVPDEVAQQILVARAALGDAVVGEQVLEQLALGGEASARLLALRPVPAIVEAAIRASTSTWPWTEPACTAVLAATGPLVLDAARAYVESPMAAARCRKAASEVIVARGRADDRRVLSDTASARMVSLSQGEGPLTEAERADAAWAIVVQAGVPPEQRVPWETTRTVYLKLAASGSDDDVPALAPDVFRSILGLRTASSPAPDSRLLDAVRSVSARPAAAAAALGRLGVMGEDPELGGRIFETLAPGSAASPCARVPDLDDGIALARLLAAALVGGRSELAAARVAGISADGADALAAMAARHGALPAAPMVPLLTLTRDPALPAALALGCDASCEGPLREVLRGPSPWARASAAAIAGAAGMAGLAPELRTVSRAAAGPGRAEATIALVALGVREAGLDAQLAAALADASEFAVFRASVARAAAGWPQGDSAGDPDADCAAPGPDPLGPWMAAAFAVRSLARGAAERSATGEAVDMLAWGARCLASGTAIDLPEPLRSLDGAPPALRRAMVGALVQASRRLPAAAFLPPLATDDDDSVRAELAVRLGENPGPERARFSRVFDLLAADPSSEVREAAARSLPVGPHADELFTSLLDDPAAAVRVAALRHPGLVGSLAVESAALRAADTDTEVRRALVDRVRQDDLPHGRAILRRLAADPLVRRAAVAGLCERGIPGDLDTVLSAIRSAPSEERSDLIGDCPSARRLVSGDPAALASAAGDRDAERAAAAVALAERVTPPERVAVLQRALRHRAASVRVAAAAFAVQAVVDDGDAPGGIDVAARLFSDRDPTVRCAVLAGAGTPSERATLAEALAPGRVPPDFDRLSEQWRCAER